MPATPPPLADDLDAASLRTAIERTRPVWARAGDAGTNAAAERLVEILATTPDPGERRAAVAGAFRVLRVTDPLLLTAYYEPELAARLAPDPTFHHPIYGRPRDLVDVDPAALDVTCACRSVSGRLEGSAVRPFPSRAEIDAGVLAGRGLEVAWAADPIALFVLHVQGSGRLRLDDGRVLGIRFAGTNGRPYRSIARVLTERGLLHGSTSSPAIRHALDGLPPAEQASILETNERYTFFRLANGGPVGSVGVELTPGRSIATDPRLVPPGSLAYLATPTVHRFVVAQDAGAAIKGAHVDLFVGAGEEAEVRAGEMREHGALYLLRPR